MHDFNIKEGDTRPSLEAQLLDENNEPRNLQGASVRFHMEDVDTGSVVVDAEAGILNAQDGRVIYEWQNGDTDEPGRYEAEFEVDYGNGEVETFPNNGYIGVYVDDDIA
jgi:hypothetical protein